MSWPKRPAVRGGAPVLLLLACASANARKTPEQRADLLFGLARISVGSSRGRLLSRLWWHGAAVVTKEGPMSHIRVLICRVDDPDTDQLTELAAFDLPPADVASLQPETALDALETTTHETGQAILRRLLQARWDLIDADLTDN